MATVPKALSEEHAPKFREMNGIQIGNGASRQSLSYRIPQREACLMTSQ